MSTTYSKPLMTIVSIEAQNILAAVSGDDVPTGTNIYDEGFDSESSSLSNIHINSIWNDENEEEDF